MYLDTALFLAGLASLLLFGLVAYGLKISQNTQSMIILLMICGFMYMYLFGLDRYRESNYQKALDTPQQTSTCAVFVRQIQFNISRKQQSETAFQFKTTHSEFLEFNGDLIAFQHIPQLQYLQSGHSYCFRYASDIHDWNGRLILTELHPSPN